MSELADNVLARLKSKEVSDAKDTPLPEVNLKPFEMTVGELRAVCDKNPAHPLSAQKRQSVQGMPNSQKVVCDQPDIEAILDNKDIVIVEETAERNVMDELTKVTIRRKKLVPFGKQPPVEAAAKQPK